MPRIPIDPHSTQNRPLRLAYVSRRLPLFPKVTAPHRAPPTPHHPPHPPPRPAPCESETSKAASRSCVVAGCASPGGGVTVSPDLVANHHFRRPLLSAPTIRSEDWPAKGPRMSRLARHATASLRPDPKKGKSSILTVETGPIDPRCYGKGRGSLLPNTPSQRTPQKEPTLPEGAGAGAQPTAPGSFAESGNVFPGIP